MSNDVHKFCILSLDGGGVRGYLTALILQNIEQYLNEQCSDKKPITDRFDLIAGTSTGGIIALGLAAGVSIEDIVEFYLKDGPRIFGRPQKRSWLASLFLPKYRSDTLRCALDGVFHDKTLRDLKSDVCITTVALQNAKPRFYKSDYASRNSGRLDEKLVDIACATAAAPTYFKSHDNLLYSHNLIDGGICANNPAMIALVEAFQFEKESKRGVRRPDNPETPRNNIIMVSVGTGERCAMPYNLDRLRNGGWLWWAKPIYEILLETQPYLIHFQAKFLLGEDNYLRINPLLKFPMKLDDISKIEELKNLADIDKSIANFLNKNF